MRDFARSDHPRVQAQLDRLGRLSVPDGRLGLETVRALLDQLGHGTSSPGEGDPLRVLRQLQLQQWRRRPGEVP